MTITQLSYILAVAEHKNFSYAAELCNVTQPTMSMQIQKLEEELDVQIFDRRTKPVKVTELGTAIIEQAKMVLHESAKIKAIIDSHKNAEHLV